MSMETRIKQQAELIGFDLAGIVSAAQPVTYPAFQNWLQQGFAGEMHYLPRREVAYSHPQHVLASVKSVIMLAINYKPGHETENRTVARYACISVDYHDVIRVKLKQLANWMKQENPEVITRGVVDTAPLLERDFAQQAGLGWFGKNTMLIHKKLGSYIFLAALLTNLDLQPDQPFHTQHCGTCTRCLEACPTSAFTAPYTLDATKCISYFTIEYKGLVAEELRSAQGSWMFGCDICQEVCPWNRKSPAATSTEFQATELLESLTPLQLLKLNEDEFEQLFGKTPVMRTGWTGMLRNAIIAAVNTSDSDCLPLLKSYCHHSDEQVRQLALWGVQQFKK